MESNDEGEARTRSLDEWTGKQIELWRSLEGAVILKWSGEEVALWEFGPEGRPVFERADFPFIQSGPLEINCLDRPVLRVITNQNEETCSLWLRDDMGPLDPEGHWGIFRFRDNLGLAVGTVETVELFMSAEGNIAEVRIVVAGIAILLVAGEVSETSPVDARLIWQDESVLVFSRPDAADSLPWSPERAPIALKAGNARNAAGPNSFPGHLE